MIKFLNETHYELIIINIKFNLFKLKPQKYLIILQLQMSWLLLELNKIDGEINKLCFVMILLKLNVARSVF